MITLTTIVAPTKKLGSFDIPDDLSKSTNGARRAYRLMWGRDWPEDDDYLRTLARQVPPAEPGFSRCKFLLMRMREDHPFTPEA